MARRLLRELPSFFKLLLRLIRDPAVPRFDKLLFGAVALYVVTPADLIPDFLGLLGWVDDLYLIGIATARLMASAGPDRLLAHWDGDPAALGLLVEGVEELGGALPVPIRRALRRFAGRPPRSGRRPPRRISIDNDDRVHVEE